MKNTFIFALMLLSFSGWYLCTVELRKQLKNALNSEKQALYYRSLWLKCNSALIKVDSLVKCGAIENNTNQEIKIK